MKRNKSFAAIIVYSNCAVVSATHKEKENVTVVICILMVKELKCEHKYSSSLEFLLSVRTHRQEVRGFA